jgi:hypothetical protein
MLSHYGKNRNCIEFLCGDNCKTNGATADLLGVPLVGCASHRLNLAAASLYEDPRFAELIVKVESLVKNLRTLKNVSIMRNFGPTKGLLMHRRNATRWSSTYYMIKRFLQLFPHLPQMGLPAQTVRFFPTYADVEDLKALFEMMKEFQSATKMLQREDSNINLAYARGLFDELIQLHPQVSTHLANNASIVHNPIFENAIVKLQNG